MDIKKLLHSMTLDEKLGQMLQVHTRWLVKTDADLTGPEKSLGIPGEKITMSGSVLSFSGAKEMKAAQKLALERSPSKIPMLFMQNVICGHKTIHPIPLAMGATFNPDLLKECCEMAAKESAASGVHVTFAPMLDLVRDARWGRVMESTGEDPYLNSVMAKSFVEGWQGNFKKKHNIAVCIKHFAAYGAVEAGRDYNSSDMSEHTLRQYYLPAYKAAIDAGAEMVMSSFNTIGGVPATANRHILNDILRDEYNFDGVLISDYNAIGELIAHGYCESEKDAAEAAINCNIDIEMMSSCYFKSAKQLLSEGKITMQQIDKMVLRILRLKDKMGLFKNPYSYADEESEKKIFLSKKHREIARRACEEACVLLKNDGALPLKKEEKIALIGPFGDCGETLGHWNSLGNPEDTVTLYNGMRRHTYARNIYLEKGASFLIDDTDRSAFPKARSKMKKADKIVLAIGEHQMYSGEGRSRANICLPQLHIELAREAKLLGKPVIAVVYGGRPLELLELSKLCDSILFVWQPGTEGGNAIANLLYGEKNPSGKLPMSFPYSVAQMPLYYNHLSTGRPKAPGDTVPSHPSEMHFTSMYMDMPNNPLYPFGFGLSYTTFYISEPRLSSDTLTKSGKITATVTVKNTGNNDGCEVVEMYIRDNFASICRPVKELKGFKKIFLKAGEEKQVSFEISEEMLRFYNAENNFVSESGDFTIMIGNSSEQTKDTVFTLK